MHADFVTLDSPRWNEVVARMPHDFFHRAEYVRLAAEHERGEPLGFVACDGDAVFLAPLIVKPIAASLVPECERWFDAASPYGYAAPVVSPKNPPADFLKRAVSEFKACLQRRKIVACFLRLHPLLELPLDDVDGAGEVVMRGRTVSIDLTQPEADIWAQIRKSHRRNLKRAAENGYVAAYDESWSEFEAFLEIYEGSMRRLGARSYYFFPRAFFEGLRNSLREHVHLFVVRKGSDVAAASLYTECGGIVSAFLGGTAGRFVEDSPLKCLDYQVSTWAKARNNRVFHMGGGLGGKEDSLFDFKAGFSPRRHPFRTWHIIADQTTYGDLVARRGRQNLPASDGFFPAYRAPL